MKILKSPWAQRALGALVLAIALPWLGIFAASLFVSMPRELGEGAAKPASIVLRDRDGIVFREVRDAEGERARWVALEDTGPFLAPAIVAAEDKRFTDHFGVDPVAIARAAALDLVRMRIVSGASTITQQLARNVAPHPRTLFGKLQEMALALKIERSLTKREILEQYMNRVAFGPNVRGVEAASFYYFDRPAKALSLGEAATLASIPRGPTVYDPKRGTSRVEARRRKVLERMRGMKTASEDDARRAANEPIAIAKTFGGLGAPHFVEAMLSGKIDRGEPALRSRASSITTTIDRDLQREVEVLAQGTVRSLEAKHVTAASVVVLENATGDVLAWVGSPDASNVSALGGNDGVLARRQPGSSLKPFVYELAMERLGFTAATRLPDVELHLPTRDGDYSPHDYDGRFHGPVLLRDALASSFNVPAVFTASELGAKTVKSRLVALGFTGLDRPAEDYGAALALGDAEVRLLDLANAYATIARGGVWLPVRAVKSAKDASGGEIAFERAGDTRVMDAADAFVVTDILADKDARIAAFGQGNVLELPFACAVKTGTSKGYRDNITVGFTPRVTVAVWVGNFDGAPMEGVSGVTGAGPLFHDAMVAAARERPAGDFVRPDDAIEDVEICPLSGERPGPHCAHTRHEIFARHAGRSSAPERACSMHVEVAIDPRNGLLAGPGCAAHEERVFEAYAPDLLAWAKSAGRPLAPETFSPLCPGSSSSSPSSSANAALRVAYPPDGATFALDDAASSKQSLAIRADVPPGARSVALVVDGRAHPVASPFALAWPMTPGAHRVKAIADGKTSEEVEFSVE